MKDKARRYSSTIPMGKGIGYMEYDDEGWWMRHIDFRDAIADKDKQIAKHTNLIKELKGELDIAQEVIKEQGKFNDKQQIDFTANERLRKKIKELEEELNKIYEQDCSQCNILQAEINKLADNKQNVQAVTDKETI